MVRIPIKTSSCDYEAVIEQNVLARAGVVLRARLRGAQPLFVVTVPPVRRRWGRVMLTSLEARGFTPTVLGMRAGERFKRLSTMEDLAGKLVKAGADGKAVVLAFGGGVVGAV